MGKIAPEEVATRDILATALAKDKIAEMRMRSYLETHKPEQEKSK